MRRLKWAQTLVLDPSHHAQVLAGMFGKLPAEPSSTLGLDGEITPEANPWAVRWMEDLEALQPYDERGVVQRMGKNVRALFLDRELAADFVAIAVSVLRLQSLSTQVPPWDFREEVGHPMEVSQGGVPQWRCCFDDQCEAKFESFEALATHVLRHHRQMETVSRLVLANQCPACREVHGDRNAAHRHLLSSLRRGSCRDRSRYLGQVHIPQALCCPVCSAEPGNWSELQSHLAEHLSTVFNGSRNAGMGETQVGRGRLYHDSAGAIKNKPEAERADAQEQLGPPIVYVWVAFLRSLASTKELGAEHVAVLKQYWENSVLKSAPARSVLQSEAVQESRGQGRVDAHCVLPGLDHPPPRGSTGGSIAAAERGEEIRPRAKRPPRTRSSEAPDTDAREIERLAKWNITVNAWLSSCVGGCWSRRWRMPS